MYTLYWSPGTASLCVHWMLIELGEPHELVKLDIEAGEHRKPEYLKLNPGGVVPTLVVEGVPLGESAALCMILGERHPQVGGGEAHTPSFAAGAGGGGSSAFGSAGGTLIPASCW